MSGSLAPLLTSIVSGVTTLSGPTAVVFGGSGAVVLGPVTFAGFEVPESITRGGRQGHNVHQLPGGTRVIDVTGREDMAIKWSGVLMQDQATQRSRQLDELRVAGAVVLLSWASYLYSVVVTDFQCKDMQYRSEYTIECTVLRDETAATPQSTPSALDQLRSDANAGLGMTTDVGSTGSVGTVVTAMTSLQVAAAAANVAAPGSAASKILGSQAASTVLTIASARTISDTTLVATGGTALQATSAVAGSSTLTSVTSALGQTATLSAVSGYVARAAKNFL